MKVRTINRRLREQAAHICEVEASTPDLCGSSWCASKALGLPEDAGDLACDATISKLGGSSPEAYAEAALLLREGFTPEGWIAVIG